MKARKAIPLTLGGIAALAVIFVLLGTAGVATWEYTNSDAFCTDACHEVHPEEAFAHKASQHARVACVECHVGRISTFNAMIEKSGHITHAWGKVFGYERPLTAPSMPAARDSCEGCHTTDPHPHNSIRVRRHFAPDEKNTETKITLVARTVGRSFQGGQSPGVRWHIQNPVRYIATDPQRVSIPWVEATYPDGTTVVYQDGSAKLAPDAIAAETPRVMECIDCHNLAGHPIRSPEDLADEALAAGDLNPRFPYVKQRVVELLNRKFQDAAEAQRLVDEAWQQYRNDFPDLAEKYPDDWRRGEEFLEERQEELATLMLRNQFLAAEVSWRSFPDHLGHRNSPGCFRCHSGRHVSEDGRMITVKCTACHGIPIVTQRDRIPGQILDLTDKRSPRSHMRPDFPFVHGELAREEDAGCDVCHGEIKFGRDNETFCANSGCHDATWPNFGQHEPETTASLGQGLPALSLKHAPYDNHR
jgi:hypothetical protein